MIIVNARFLTQPITGVQRFAIEIAKELKKSDLKIEFVAPRNIVHKELAHELGVKKMGFLEGHLWEQITLQRYVLRNKYFLLSLGNTAPMFVNNQLITIHDLSFRFYPQWNSKLFSFVYNRMIPIIAKKAKHVITVSESSKGELVKELKLNETKVSIVYNAVSPIFKPENVFKTMDEEYILTVSSHHPRKNFERLIEAFLKIANKEIKLYVVGNVNKHFSKLQLSDAQANSRIKILRNINDNELARLYANSSLFVYPSIYEGFGIPIIEALTYQISVCVSNISVFHEVCGDTATYFNPLDVNDIKEKIELALERRIKPNFDTAKFSWQKSGDKVKKLLIIHSKK